MLHRAGLAHDFDAFGAQLSAGFIDVRNAQCDVPETVANIVRVRVPVVSQFDDRVGLLRPVADKDIGKPARRIFPLFQQFHAKPVAIEFQTLIEIIDSDHRVDDFHSFPPYPIDLASSRIFTAKSDFSSSPWQNPGSFLPCCRPARCRE